MASISKYLTSSNGKQLSQRAYNAYLKIKEEEENEEKERQELLKQQTALNDEYKTVRGELGIDTLNEQVESTRRVLGNSGNIISDFYENVFNNLLLQTPQQYFDQENRKQYEDQYQGMVDELKKNETAYKNRIGEENYNNLLIELGQSAPQTASTAEAVKQDLGLSRLQIARNSAWDQYAKDGTMVSLEKAEALDKELKQYQIDNPDTGKELFSPTTQYIPQGIYYGVRNLPAAAAAVITTGLTGSATAGKTIYGLGTVLTGYDATYEQTRGGEFGDMVSLGIPEDIALEASSDSAFWQALIEEAETAKDIYQLFTLPQSEGVTNTLKEFFKDWGMNVVSEGLEEGSQSIVGFVHEWNAMERAGLDTSSYTIANMAEQAWEEALGGAQVGATLYLAEGLPHIAIGQGVNAISGKSSIQTAPLSNITVEELPLIIKEDSVTVDRKALKPLISDIYDLNIKAAQSENTSLGNATAEQLIIGKQRMTSEKTLNTLADGIDESLNKTVANNRQVMTDTQKQNYQAVLNEEQESIRQSNPLFDKIELTVANKISTVQDNVRKFFERLGVNIVFYDSFSDEAVDTAGDRIYYNSNGFYRNGNTIYVNRLNSDVKSLLASGGHEAAHIILNNDPKILENMKKQYSPSDVAQYISDRNIVLDFEPGETAYEAGLKEMFSDSVGELLSTRQAVAKIENATKGFKGNAKQVLDNFMQNAVGVQSENTSLTQYDLEGESILSGNQLSQEEQDTVLTKLTGKQVSSSKYQSLYDNMVADNKSEKSIRSALAVRMGALPNSDTVNNELKKLKQSHTTKQSASVSKNSTKSKWYEKQTSTYIKGSDGYQYTTIDFSKYKDIIENSMSMAQAEEMIRRAFALASDKKSFTVREDDTFRTWAKRNDSENIANEILKSGNLVRRFVNPIKEFNQQPHLIEGVVRAYLAGALKGNLVVPTKYKGKINVSKETIAKNITGGFGPRQKASSAKDILRAADKSKKAQFEFVSNVMDREWLAKSNIRAKEAYEYVNKIANLDNKVLNLISSLNRGVAFENRWTGIENSSIIKDGVFDLGDLKDLGVTFTNVIDSNEDVVKYVINTILATDTHQQWNGLRFTMKSYDGGAVLGEYFRYEDKIEISKESQNTVAHEMGHRLDKVWGEDLLYKYTVLHGQDNYLTNILDDSIIEGFLPTESMKDFVYHFYEFLDNIAESASLHNKYTMDYTETFARFFAKFIEWTTDAAHSSVMDEDAAIYDDAFTAKQMKEFVKILQEKSALDTELAVSDLLKQRKEWLDFERENYAKTEYFTNMAIDVFNNWNEKNSFFDEIMAKKDRYANSTQDFEVSKAIKDTPYFRQMFDRIEQTFRNEIEQSGWVENTRSMERAIGNSASSNQLIKSEEDQRVLYNRAKQSARITKKDRIIKNQRKKINRLEKKIDKQRTADEMWIKRTERAKLLKKIDTKDQKILRLKDREQIRKLEAKDKAVRERMQKRVSEMRQTLRDTIRKFKNSEAFKYLSKEEQEQFKESFGSYYLKANSKTELTRMKEYVKSMIAQMLEEDPNIVISNKIREMITAPGQKTFSEVQSLEDLEELYKSLKDVIDQAKGIKKLVGLERSQDVDKVRTEFVNATQERYNEVEDKKSLRSKKREQREASVGGKIVNALGTGLKITKDNIAQLYVKKLDTLKTQLLYMAGGNRNSKMMELYENLQEGVSRERTAYVGLNKVLSSFLNDKEYAELRKSLREKADWKDMGIKVKDIAGREHELRLNEALLISLAMHSMQDQSLAHIGGRISDIVVEDNGRGRPLKRQGGGLTIPNEELLKAGKVSEAIKAGYIVKLSPKQINEIVGKQIDGNGNITFTKLTKQQNEFISGLQNFFEKTAEYTNEVYKIMHGRDLSIVENYFPIMSNKAYIYRGFDENSSLVSSNEAESWGIIDNSGFTKERNENAFNPIVLERVTDVITRMINGVSKYYGYNLALYNNNVLLESRNADGISANDMFNKIDSTFEDNYKTLTGFLSGKLRQPNDMFAKFRGKHAEFTLGLNPSVWVKQLLSVPTTMKYFKTSDLISFIAGGEARLHSAMRDYLEANNISERGKVLHNFLSFLTNDIEYRSLGFGQVDAEDLKNNKSLFERLDLLKGIARMDMLGVDTVSRMFLYSELNNRGLLDGGLTQLSAEQTDEIFDDIGRRLEEFLRETQPDYSQVNRPNIVRNRGVVSRFLTMYSTATLQMFNNMASSMSELRYAIKTKDKKLIGQMTARMIKSALGVLVASAGSAAISRMFDKLLKQKDDDDDYDYGKEVIVTLLAPTLILDDIARGALGLAQYDSQTPELAAYDAIIGLAGDIRDLITGSEEVKFKQLESIIKNIGLATGIPTRDLMNLTKTTLLMSGSDLYYQIALRENQYAYKKWLDGNMGQNVKDFYSAYVETRDAKLESKYGYQKGAGIKTGEEGSKKKSFQKALENVFPGDKAKVNEYMVILGGYKK